MRTWVQDLLCALQDIRKELNPGWTLNECKAWEFTGNNIEALFSLEIPWEPEEVALIVHVRHQDNMQNYT